MFGAQDEDARGVVGRRGFALARGGWRGRDGLAAGHGKRAHAHLLQREVQVAVDAHGRLVGDILCRGLACDVETDGF